MSGKPSRLIVHLKDPSSQHLPIKVQAAVLLAQMINLWFNGNQRQAAKAFGIAHQTLNHYLVGYAAVSRPMVRRMAKMLSQAEELERRRERQERLGQSNRRAVIPIMRSQVERLEREFAGIAADMAGVARTAGIAGTVGGARSKENGPPERAA